jgi:hypothetical protein
MNPTKSIAFIVCYLGKLPWYFNYFVHSCKYNPTVDFYIITDDEAYAHPLPGNVKLVYKTLPEINLAVTKKLGFEVNITHGYKLCDFKPAYGFIFPELIEGYDFWGYCDIDIIFGNIRDFMTDDLLESYDLISTRPDWIPGCFLLFKNCLKMNTLFQQSKDYKKVFTGQKHYCFDETNFAHSAFEAGKTYLEINTEIESMMHVVQKMEEKNYIKPFFDLFIIEGGCPGNLKWENGKMSYKNRFEILLYHLIKFRKVYTPKRRISYIPESFTISPTKIYHTAKSKGMISEV